MTISVYPQGTTVKGRPVPAAVPSGQMEFQTYLGYIKDGKWEDTVHAVRTNKMDKALAPGVTISGTFSRRETKSLIAHSGIIAIDLDAQDNPEMQVDELAADPFLYALHRSIRGSGFVAYFRIDPDKHLDAYLSLEKRLADSYGLIADPSGKDVSRYRFVSHDPEAFIRNTPPPVYKSYLQKQKEVQRRIYPHSESDISHILDQIQSRRINLAESYHDWVNIAFGFAEKYGEGGRGYFHTVSQQSVKYNAAQCDKKYDSILKSGSRGRTIATFFYLAKQAGVEIQTNRTKHIQTTATIHRKKIGQNGGYQSETDARQSAERILKDIDGLEGDDVKQVIDAVFEMDASELKQGAANDLDDIKAFIRSCNLEFNEVTRCYERDGNPMQERDINSIFISALETLGKKNVNRQILEALIDSDFIPKYNPFKRFFDKHGGDKPDGNIEKLCECIQFRQVVNRNDTELQVSNYVDVYLTKWMLSVVASMHGTYSLMCLVLAGSQGIGKTNFFRWLLPEELQAYYGESKLDAGKDDEMLMCKKIILCDDEFGGKSKQEAKKLKELSSKQTFSIRRPYGRVHEDLNRLAVLCGTSNDDEIINDPTGNRRIIPINVISIDWEKYKQIDKTALWVELYHYWQQVGDGWMLTPDEVANLNEATKENEQPSIEREAILMFFEKPEQGEPDSWWPNTKIKNYIESHSRLQISSYKLGLNLKRLGFEKKSVKIGGVPALCYGVSVKNSDNPYYQNPTDNQHFN
jgi:hypothetical protein